MPGIGAGQGQVQQKLLLRVPQMHRFTRFTVFFFAQLIVPYLIGHMDINLLISLDGNGKLWIW